MQPIIPNISINTFVPLLSITTMAESYQSVERRIEQAIDAINTRGIVNKSAIAREFRVSLSRLRSRLDERSFKIEVREMHERRLKSDQKLTLREYLLKLNEISILARLRMIESAAMILLRQDCNNEQSSLSLSSQ